MATKATCYYLCRVTYSANPNQPSEDIVIIPVPPFPIYVHTIITLLHYYTLNLGKPHPISQVSVTREGERNEGNAIDN